MRGEGVGVCGGGSGKVFGGKDGLEGNVGSHRSGGEKAGLEDAGDEAGDRREGKGGDGGLFGLILTAMNGMAIPI